MSITLDKILQRLQAELNVAQGTGNAQKKREHLAAMKTLCELALESGGESDAANTRTQATPVTYPSSFVPPTPTPTPVTITKPMKEEDANGDSLFDF